MQAVKQAEHGRDVAMDEDAPPFIQTAIDLSLQKFMGWKLL